MTYKISSRSARCLQNILYPLLSMWDAPEPPTKGPSWGFTHEETAILWRSSFAELDDSQHKTHEPLLIVMQQSSQ